MRQVRAIPAIGPNPRRTADELPGIKKPPVESSG
jgi:hypothetical protein